MVYQSNYYPNNYGNIGYQSPSYQPQGIMVNWVNSEDEARNSYVSNNSSAYFMSREDAVMYMKMVDANGVPSFKVYDLVERVQPVQLKVEGYKKPEANDYVKASELSALIGSLVEEKMESAGWHFKKKKDEEK